MVLKISRMLDQKFADSLNEFKAKIKPDIQKTAHVNSAKDIFFM